MFRILVCGLKASVAWEFPFLGASESGSEGPGTSQNVSLHSPNF